ncbi:hypothetical protein [[Mycobacterium] burgundiense]|uniref:DUF2516 domain-containing protein n=1 Tax=[Mycobacterium] burgundiense TaxID=3064286 RepID=A0ABN9NRE7_9MYCO|nr:hypothetical protein [Mycolicibacterium sp. MU0053]CAJ1509010.1 hypothetical protein MU0053_004041 [Mycolicibacterium sp. MU0053]
MANTSNDFSAVLGYLGIAALVLGGVLSTFPLWKSATLSPDSIERRVYWTSTTLAILLFFLSALPNWRAGLFVSVAAASVVVAVALRWTNHVKVGGRIYGTRRNRGADRPPALAPRHNDG